MNTSSKEDIDSTSIQMVLAVIVVNEATVRAFVLRNTKQRLIRKVKVSS